MVADLEEVGIGIGKVGGVGEIVQYMALAEITSENGNIHIYGTYKKKMCS